MAKKRVAIFGIKYFPSKGGTSRVVENLLWELRDHFDFTIYCYEHESASTHIPGVKTIQFPEIPVKGVGVFLYYLRCCMHLLLKGKHDLVHAQKTDAAFFLPILGLKFKLVATSHALPYLNEKWSGIGRLYFRMAERFFVRSKAVLTAVSKPQVEYYWNKYRREVSYIPNGILPVEKNEPQLADKILSEHKISSDYILFAARRLIPLKGCHTLLKAMKRIDFKGTLVVAADTGQLPAYTGKLKSLAEGMDVKFIGYISDRGVLDALIRRARFFVFPSELEGMSMMLLETGSLGTPMICSDIPQNLAVMSAEEVLYFKSKNVVDLAGKLQWAFHHPDEMKDLARKAKLKIENKYLVSKVAMQYVDLYDNLVPQTQAKKSWA